MSHREKYRAYRSSGNSSSRIANAGSLSIETLRRRSMSGPRISSARALSPRPLGIRSSGCAGVICRAFLSFGITSTENHAAQVRPSKSSRRDGSGASCGCATLAPGTGWSQLEWYPSSSSSWTGKLSSAFSALRTSGDGSFASGCARPPRGSRHASERYGWNSGRK